MWMLSLVVRVWCGILGLMLVLHAIRDKGNYRWGFYDIEDESDVPLGRRLGRLWYFALGAALVLGAIFIRSVHE